MEKSEARFCSHCGEGIVGKLVGAETNMMCYGDMSTVPLASAYDEKTGERQYCYRYICPEYKKFPPPLGWLMFSRHDDYFINTIIKS